MKRWLPKYQVWRDKRTLRRLNQFRNALGLEAMESMPLGVRRDSRCCPWHQALCQFDPGIVVGSRYIQVSTLGHAVKLAEAMRTWPTKDGLSVALRRWDSWQIRQFDKGKRPQWVDQTEVDRRWMVELDDVAQPQPEAELVGV